MDRLPPRIEDVDSASKAAQEYSCLRPQHSTQDDHSGQLVYTAQGLLVFWALRWIHHRRYKIAWLSPADENGTDWKEWKISNRWTYSSSHLTSWGKENHSTVPNLKFWNLENKVLYHTTIAELHEYRTWNNHDQSINTKRTRGSININSICTSSAAKGCHPRPSLWNWSIGKLTCMRSPTVYTLAGSLVPSAQDRKSTQRLPEREHGWECSAASRVRG